MTGVSESPNPVGTAVDLPEAYLQSEECRSVQTEIRPILENLQEKQAQPGAVRWTNTVKWWKGAMYATSFPWQVKQQSSMAIFLQPLTSPVSVSHSVNLSLSVSGCHWTFCSQPCEEPIHLCVSGKILGKVIISFGMGLVHSA